MAIPKMKAKAKPAPVVVHDEDDDDELEAPAPTPKRGRKAAAAPAAAPKKEKEKEKVDLLYGPQYTIIFDELPNGRDTALCVGDQEPRGPRQIEAMEALRGRGKKKTTVTMLLDALEDTANKDGIVSHMINKGVIGVAA